MNGNDKIQITGVVDLPGAYPYKPEYNYRYERCDRLFALYAVFAFLFGVALLVSVFFDWPRAAAVFAGLTLLSVSISVWNLILARRLKGKMEGGRQ